MTDEPGLRVRGEILPWSSMIFSLFTAVNLMTILKLYLYLAFSCRVSIQGLTGLNLTVYFLDLFAQRPLRQSVVFNVSYSFHFLDHIYFFGFTDWAMNNQRIPSPEPLKENLTLRTLMYICVCIFSCTCVYILLRHFLKIVLIWTIFKVLYWIFFLI